MPSKFINPHLSDTKRGLRHLLLWAAGYYVEPSPRLPLPADFIYPAAAGVCDRGHPSAVWIGHSTYLIEIGGLTILTDPVWDAYCSPIPFKSLRRRLDPSVPLADLPKIDCVLISHNHYDHLDAKTVRHLHSFHPEIQWIVPLNLSSWFRRRGIDRVAELDRWNTFKLGKAIITAVPCQHYSGRTLWDKDRTFWNGYVFEFEGRRFYFTGDTGYNKVDFKQIGDHWPCMDLSLIPIGTYVPEEFMKPVHCSPKEAVAIHLDVKSKLSLGMHWKTFCLSEEPMDRPPYDLYLAMSEKKLPYDTFLPIDPGIYVNWGMD